MKIKKKLICQMPNGTDYGFPDIVEGNQWHDTFWGVCNGVGQNNLGQILMNVRGILRDERAMMERACEV